VSTARCMVVEAITIGNKARKEMFGSRRAPQHSEDPMTKEEEELVRVGVKAASKAMFDCLHSEDDHGWDLAKWLEANVGRITTEACGRIGVGRAALVD
jgi:hypothetical protein